jgi:hypothetical protein
MDQISFVDVKLEDVAYIDTKALCEQLKKELSTHKISQLRFASVVLDRSQGKHCFYYHLMLSGTLSEILKRPGPWEKLQKVSDF